MNAYKPIAHICLEHDYYVNCETGSLSLEPTLRTRNILWQRGVMLARVNTNMWQLIAPDQWAGFMDDDVFELSLTTSDPDFMHKTMLGNFAPQNLYNIPLEQGTTLINNDFVWTPAPSGRKQPGEICLLTLNPAEFGRSEPRYTIRFGSRAYYWEYLFVPRSPADESGHTIVLETVPKGKVTFAPPCMADDILPGRKVWRVVSNEPVRLSERYDFTIQLYTGDDSNGVGKRLLNRFIPHPDPGRFVPDNTNVVRNICYI